MGSWKLDRSLNSVTEMVCTGSIYGALASTVTQLYPHELIHYSIRLLASTLWLTLSYELDKQSLIVPHPGLFSGVPFIFLCKRRAIVFPSAFLSHSLGWFFFKGLRDSWKDLGEGMNHTHVWKPTEELSGFAVVLFKPLEIHLRFLGEAPHWLGGDVARRWWILGVRSNSQSLPKLLLQRNVHLSDAEDAGAVCIVGRAGEFKERCGISKQETHLLTSFFNDFPHWFWKIHVHGRKLEK